MLHSGFNNLNHSLPKKEDPKTSIPPRYQYIDELGRGGMGVVYKVKDSKMEREVALKMIIATNEMRQKRFEREVKAMANCRHLNIIEVYDYNENPLYYTMPLMACSLDDKLQQKIALDKCILYTSGILNGLDFLHQKGWVHRDLKPENVFFDGKTPKLADFGLVFHREYAKLTLDNHICGTLQYMSPEQLDSKSDLDYRSDFFAVGILLYRMLTGKNLFSDTTGIIDHIASEQYIQKQIRDIPQPLQPLCTKLLQQDKQQRYQDVNSIINDLSNATTNTTEFENAVTEVINENATTVTPPSTQVSPQIGTKQWIAQQEKQRWQKKYQQALAKLENATGPGTRRKAELEIERAVHQLRLLESK